MKPLYSVASLKKKLQEKGHQIFSHARYPYNLNIVGIRNKRSVVDIFSDQLNVFWQTQESVFHRAWPITTYPGLHYLLNPMNIFGTAILVPGQYRASHELGTYKGYEALRQVEDVAVYRDNNRNEGYDAARKSLNPESVQVGNFGIHIHRAGFFSKIIGVNSAGCQVFQKSEDFKDFMGICKKASEYWGDRFTYTLIDRE